MVLIYFTFIVLLSLTGAPVEHLADDRRDRDPSRCKQHYELSGYPLTL
jgi:hypothetical protein